MAVSSTREAHGGVLVVGGGFAGAYVARELRARGATIVSKENFMLYTPLLPEAASGTLEPRHCVVPLREMCPHAELILGSVTGLDLQAHTAAVKTDEGVQTVAWRELVVALGAVPRTLPIPGLSEHALSFKSLADAIHLRNHVLHQLEAADAALDEEERSRRLTFVFVGAGYAGVEALAELLTRAGARAIAGEDQLIIVGPARPPAGEVTSLPTFDDHRIAMAAALLALAAPGCLIENPDCVAKSYPNFFRDLESLVRR